VVEVVVEEVAAVVEVVVGGISNKSMVVVGVGGEETMGRIPVSHQATMVAVTSMLALQDIVSGVVQLNPFEVGHWQ
jgi:hypothetical protein